MDDLPNELLIHIVDQLRGPTTWAEPADYSRTHALAALCCVSKKLYHISRPLLYESIDLPPTDGFLPQSQRLFARLQEQPSLRFGIKALRQKTRARIQDGDGTMSVRDEYRRDITRDVRTFGLGTEDASALVGRWLGYEDLYFALVAFRTPNLERLWVRSAVSYEWPHRSECNNTLLEAIGRMAMGASWLHTHRFDNLKILYFDFSNSPEMSARYALPLLLLPNLDELTLVALGGWFYVPENEFEGEWEGESEHEAADDDLTMFGRPWLWPVRSSPITKLSLFKPVFSEIAVKKMILACKALERFECSHPLRSSTKDQWFGALVPALNDHIESLQNLSLLCRPPRWPSLENTRMAQLDPLHEFTNLNSVRVSLNLVSNPGETLSAKNLPAFLPPSITSLHVHYPREPNDEADQQLLDVLTAYKDGVLPSLKDVYITWVYYQRRKEEFDLLERLQSLVQIKEQYETSSITFDIMLTIRDDKGIGSNWPKLANLGLVMNGTYLNTDPYDEPDQKSVFVNFTTSPARYTVQELQDDQDHLSFW